MANAYHKGQLVTIQATFTDSDGDPVAPTAVSIKFKDPSGNVDTYTDSDPEVSNPSTGVYRINLEIDQENMWWVRVESTGTGQAASESQIIGLPSRFD